MDQAFGYAFRALFCPRCSTLLSAAAGGGIASCKHCGTATHVAGRDERPLSQLETSQPISEPERFMRLRSQIGRPFIMPPMLMPLLQEGQLAPWSIQEAFAMWHGLRVELVASPRVETAETFFFLTLLLSNAEAAPPRKRALLETALDLVTLKRHRQIVRCTLAREAARASDGEAARAWLGPCDARSDDIETDSEHRFACAFIATVERRWNDVLGALGAGPQEIPIAISKSAACAVLRANAYEKQGALDIAFQLLSAEAQATGPTAMPNIERVIAANRELDLCPQSLARVRVGRRAKPTGGGEHTIGLILGGSLIAASAFMVLMAALTTKDFVAGSTRISHTPILLVLAVPMAIAGAVVLLRALRGRRILLHGLDAEARVFSVTETGARINGLPVCQMRLLISLPGQPPYEAQAKRPLDHVEIARLAPGGATVSVKVDPNDKMQIVIV